MSSEFVKNSEKNFKGNIGPKPMASIGSLLRNFHAANLTVSVLVSGGHLTFSNAHVPIIYVRKTCQAVFHTFQKKIAKG
jgi:hypothetical protein